MVYCKHPHVVLCGDRGIRKNFCAVLMGNMCLQRKVWPNGI